MNQKLRVLGFVFVCAVLAGCSSSSTSTTPTPVPGNAHIYAVDNNANAGNGVVDVYAMPLTAASTATIEFKDPGFSDPDDLTFDAAGRLFVADFGANEVFCFTPPFTASSTSSFALSGFNEPEDVAFDKTGNMYVAEANGNKVTVFNAPITASSTAAFSITNGTNHPYAVQFDATGRLFVVNDSNASINVNVYTPPFSAASAPSFTISGFGASDLIDGVFDAAGNLYVSDFGGAVWVVNAPIASGSTPSTHFFNGTTDGGYLAFDSNGRLVQAANDSNGTIFVFTPPFSAASTPSFHTTKAGGDYFGLSAGP